MHRPLAMAGLGMVEVPNGLTDVDLSGYPVRGTVDDHRRTTGDELLLQDDPFQAVRRPAVATTVRRRLITMARMSFGRVVQAIRLRMTHLDTSIIARGRGVGMRFQLVFRSVGHMASRRDIKEESFKMKDYWPW